MGTSAGAGRGGRDGEDGAGGVGEDGRPRGGKRDEGRWEDVPVEGRVGKELEVEVFVGSS